MPTLSEIRDLFEEETDEGAGTSEFNGKLKLSGKLIARAIFESLPEPVKKCMREVGGVCVAGGYIRDKLNGTTPKDIDLWIYGLSNEIRENRLQMARVSLAGSCKLCYESKYTLTYDIAGRRVQLLKKTGITPWKIINKFDFYCCKFAVYLKDGKLTLKEDDMARRHALMKILVPIRDLGEPASVLRHLSKLHRRGYHIEEEHLYGILYKHELSMPEDYGEDKRDKHTRKMDNMKKLATFCDDVKRAFPA